jgi:hypothetical protein
MKVRITDRATFESLRPAEVVAYARSEGWKLMGFWEGKRATVWQKGEERLLVPADTLLADYALRMAEVVDTLATTEGRSQLALVRDLTTASADLIRVRVASPLTDDGSLGLEEGVLLFQSMQEMLASAARAAVAPRAYFRSRLPTSAEEYLKKVRLGQTERGSYVATMVCPVSPELDVGAVSEVLEEPYDRKVTHTLSKSLLEASNAAKSAALVQSMKPFQDAVSQGVSANLCEALASLGDMLPEAHIEFGFTWARTRVQPPGAYRTLTLATDSISTLREAARILKETSWDDDFEVYGPVVRLESSDPSQGGTVIVQSLLDGGGARKVQLRLNGEAYRQAVSAHDSVADIRCRGKLKKEGRYLTISEVHGFTVAVEDWV